MTTLEQTSLGAARVRFHDCLIQQQTFGECAIEGLSRPRKALPCRFLYDARGSRLFDQICELPEYYVTRTETRILGRHARELAALVGEDALLIELGSGSSTKTRIMLDALKRPQGYVPIDVSREHLRAAAYAIAADYPLLQVDAICADYSDDFSLPDCDGGRKAAFFPGSTIGNLTSREAFVLMSDWRRRLGEDGMMILGVDLKKDPAILNAAYNDAAGVTEAFIKNILARANRELDADFDPAAFRYEAKYEPANGRVEMHLKSLAAQNVKVSGQTFAFAAGERLHIENSHKYSLAEIEALGAKAGFKQAACFTDDRGWFAVCVWTT